MNNTPYGNDSLPKKCRYVAVTR